MECSKWGVITPRKRLLERGEVRESLVMEEQEKETAQKSGWGRGRKKEKGGISRRHSVVRTQISNFKKKKKKKYKLILTQV